MVSLLDLYDEEFNRFLNLAECLIIQLPKREDRIICTKWIKKLCTMKTKDISVKRSRNEFFKYLLTVIHQAIFDNKNIFKENNTVFSENFSNSETQNFMYRWSSDKKTYVAAKPLLGRGALVYMAVSNDPSLGWDRPNKDKN